MLFSLHGWSLERRLFIMSPVMEYIDSTATDKALTLKYFLATCDKTGKSMLRFFQNNGFPTSTPIGCRPMKREMSPVTWCMEKKEKIHLENMESLHCFFHLLRLFFAAANENLFFDCESTKMRRLPRLIAIAPSTNSAISSQSSESRHAATSKNHITSH